MVSGMYCSLFFKMAKYAKQLYVERIYIEKQCNVLYTHKVALKHAMKFIRIKRAI